LLVLSGAWRHPAEAAPWPFSTEEKPGVPSRVLAVWTDTVLTQPDRMPQRGFGGRLMFYASKKDEPIKVEGTLVVYAFDETDREPNNAKPDRKYIFRKEQLPAHYSKSKIGHSYSVWLPWDEVGGMQKEITLIVRFQPTQAAVVIGQPSRQLLPGKQLALRVGDHGPWPGNGRPSYPAPGPIRPAGWESPAQPMIPAGMPGPWAAQPVSYEAAGVPAGMPESDGTASRRMATTTIAIPADMAGKMITSPAGWSGPAAAPVQAPPPGGAAKPGPAPTGWNGAPATWNAAPQAGWPYAAAANSPQPAHSALIRQWPLGEPLARLNRDRAPWPPCPATPPSAPGSPPGPESANGSPAPPSTVGSGSR
jgi:hypothetical protein